MATLRDLRRKKNMQLQEAADALHMSAGNLSRLERGITKPRTATVERLSEFYGVPIESMPDYFPPDKLPEAFRPPASEDPATFAAPLTDELTANLSPMERMKLEAYRDGLLSSRQYDLTVRIPIIGDTAAGFGSAAASEWTGEFTAIPSECLHGRSVADFFALNVRGRSMEPRIMDGDIAVVQKQDDADSGDIALVVYGDDIDSAGAYGTLKQIRKEADGALSLVALNPEFETLTLRGSDLTSVRIQGKLVQIIRAF